MSIHWTYEALHDKLDDLHQGDILFPTTELIEIASRSKAARSAPPPLGFMIVTQCCDLVRRSGRNCKANYIGIVEVREIGSVIDDLLESVCSRITYQCYRSTSKSDARDLFTRIFNQNEQALGLFYLHPCHEGSGLTDFGVAFLRSSFTVERAQYDSLVAARRGRLTSEFRNKLGWLVGNLYSRVGTPDWGDKDSGSAGLNELIEKFLDSSDIVWAHPYSTRQAIDAGVNFEGLEAGEIESELARFAPKPTRKLVSEVTSSAFNRLLDGLPLAIQAEFKKRIGDSISDEANSVYSKLAQGGIKDAIDASIHDLALLLAENAVCRLRTALASEIDETIEPRLRELLREVVCEQIAQLPEKLAKRVENAQELGVLRYRDE